MYYIDIKETYSLVGWRMNGHWVVLYKALVLIYHASHPQYHMTYHTNNDLSFHAISSITTVLEEIAKL